MKTNKIILLSAIGTLSLGSCTTVKEYQKNKLNDAEMVLSNRTIEKTELNFQSYREGASGANAGKSGGVVDVIKISETVTQTMKNEKNIY